MDGLLKILTLTTGQTLLMNQRHFNFPTSLAEPYLVRILLLSFLTFNDLMDDFSHSYTRKGEHLVGSHTFCPIITCKFVWLSDYMINSLLISKCRMGV